VKPPRILSIAGSDSSGGAGIQADIKTITMLGGFAMTAITAVTAQNTRGVTMVEALSPAMVAAQIDACVSDIGVDAVKIGMLGSPEIAAVVAERLEQLSIPVERLMQLATLTTPNVPELEALGGPAAMAARGVAYLAKGGDADGPTVEDVLVVPGAAPQVWSAPRIMTRHTHGTGCTLSSAIACGLGAGLDLVPAVEQSRAFVRAALEAAPGYGAGSGPLGHQAVQSSS
jgi:hydroxymethylpyrimidine/phosphomethylpyrimidine kinase